MRLFFPKPLRLLRSQLSISVFPAPTGVCLPCNVLIPLRLCSLLSLGFVRPPVSPLAAWHIISFPTVDMKTCFCCVLLSFCVVHSILSWPLSSSFPVLLRRSFRSKRYVSSSSSSSYSSSILLLSLPIAWSNIKFQVVITGINSHIYIVIYTHQTFRHLQWIHLQVIKEQVNAASDE